MILTQSQLAQILVITTLPVKILDVEGKRIGIIAASEAVGLMARGRYHLTGSKRRVRCMREIGPCAKPRAFPVDLHYQDGRAVIKYWSDQRSRGGHQVAA